MTMVQSTTRKLFAHTTRLVCARRERNASIAMTCLLMIRRRKILTSTLIPEQRLVKCLTPSLRVRISSRQLRLASMVSTGYAQMVEIIVSIDICFQWAMYCRKIKMLRSNKMTMSRKMN